MKSVIYEIASENMQIINAVSKFILVNFPRKIVKNIITKIILKNDGTTFIAIVSHKHSIILVIIIIKLLTFCSVHSKWIILKKQKIKLEFKPNRFN